MQININDYVKLTKKEVDWFQENMFDIKSQNRPDLERGFLLYYLCKKIKAKKVLDIGTGGFFTARSMAHYGCHVDTIDVKGSKDPKDGWDNINFMLGRSQDYMKGMIERGEKYDLIFIDGSHSYEDVVIDIQNAKKLTNLIVCHDYGNLNDITMAVDENLDNFDLILEDRMWKGAPYENGYDKNGNKIDYGVVICDIKQQ